MKGEIVCGIFSYRPVKFVFYIFFAVSGKKFVKTFKCM
ncbi:hypothetical protein BN863_32790 [Formosa agariphila KMM 3901]|uniref:Uncharacterized protein n=1 Tax=Formosa agariphila (strain DSM 15362 / KCTC 12365 / LMG 23005 / KMM 3901 / M-2Alg 35-1) TaxID=1347342 RepID=T2KRA9_FORAG|nr:hypothetical protein BN863_32790 [Formosa agariphila KMM 3901]